MKAAMKAQQKEKLLVIRQILSELKRFEIDNLIKDGINDEQALDVLSKMLKQRVESEQIFTKEGRDDLATKEQAEMEFIKIFMPEPLSEDEVTSLLKEAIDSLGASSIKDMGAVMASLKPKLQGRADLKVVSGKIRDILS